MDDHGIPSIDPGPDGSESVRGRPDVSDEELGRRLGALLRARARNVEAPRGEAVERVRAAQRAAASRRRRVVRPAIVLGLAAVLGTAGLGAAFVLSHPPRPSPTPTSSLQADRSTPSPNPTSTAGPSLLSTPVPFPKLAEVKGSFDLLPPAPSINALAVGDPLHGWAAADGAILATRDGGASWTTVWQGSERVIEVSALGPLQAWALAEPPARGGAGPGGLNPDTLLRTTDGGQTWRTVRLATPVVDLQLVADRQAWALSPPAPDPTATQHLLRTMDGGRTWEQALPGVVTALCFADAQRGWAVGANVLRTTDAGAHWTSVARLPTSLGLGSRLTCRDDTLWLMGLGPAGASFAYDLQRSTDGGLTWTHVLSDAPSQRPAGVAAGPDQLGAFDAPSSDMAFVVGLASGASATMASVTHDGGRTWVMTTLPVLPVEPSAAVALDDDHAWFAGDVLSAPGVSRGLLASTADGGTTWQERWPSPGPRPIESVAFVSADTGFGLGAFGDPTAVLRTDDGGGSWRPIGRLLASPTSSATSAFGRGWSFVDPEDGWALDGTGLERTTDGGRDWSELALPTVAAHPYAVAFSDASHGCLLATDPSSFLHALRTADGGLTWSEAPGAQSSVVACAWGQVGAALLASAQQVTGTRSDIDVSQLVIADPDHAWAAGQDSILRTTDGGAGWETVTADAALSPGALATLTFANGQDGWMLTVDGRLLRTRDGGVSWTELP